MGVDIGASGRNGRQLKASVGGYKQVVCDCLGCATFIVEAREGGTEKG